MNVFIGGGSVDEMSNSNFLVGFACGLTVFIEPKRRREEFGELKCQYYLSPIADYLVALYVLPKALESAWKVSQRHRLLPRVLGGEVILASGALAVLMRQAPYSSSSKFVY